MRSPSARVPVPRLPVTSGYLPALRPRLVVQHLRTLDGIFKNGSDVVPIVGLSAEPKFHRRIDLSSRDVDLENSAVLGDDGNSIPIEVVVERTGLALALGEDRGNRLR